MDRDTRTVPRAQEDRKPRQSHAVDTEGRCIRCRSRFGYGANCIECGVAKHRPVKRHRKRRKTGGKRGRNSGKVQSKH